MTKYDPKDAALLLNGTLNTIATLNIALQYLGSIENHLEYVDTTPDYEETKEDHVQVLLSVGNTLERTTHALTTFHFMYEHIGRTKLDKHGRRAFMKASEHLSTAQQHIAQLYTHALRVTVNRSHDQETRRKQQRDMRKIREHIRDTQEYLHVMIQPAQMKLVERIVRGELTTKGAQ